MRYIRLVFLMFVLAPLARIFTGADVVGREKLPRKGPAIIAANHNSHVDTLLLLTIFPARTMARLRPAAAADYFLRGPAIGWFSQNILGIVPVARNRAGSGEDVLAPAREALLNGDIILIFPEGTRGDASDEMAQLKSGVARLVEACPTAPVIPIWLEGAGRVLPKGAHVPVPMNCTVLVGEPILWQGDRPGFMNILRDSLLALREKAPPQRWRTPA
jgi:1-acyl-sn-glycerol-3-phosphate acyltransferase